MHVTINNHTITGTLDESLQTFEQAVATAKRGGQFVINDTTIIYLNNTSNITLHTEEPIPEEVLNTIRKQAERRTRPRTATIM